MALLTLLSVTTAQQSTDSKANQKRRETITWAPVEFPTFTPKRAWTKPKLMVNSLRTQDLSVELEQTDIRETSKQYGAKLGQQGDAADFFQWLCFVGGREEQRWALWLSSGEIDGDLVSDFSIKRIGSDAAVDSRCRSLSSSSEEPTTSPTQLRLGMSESDLKLALGEPTARRGDFLFYAHSHDLKLHNEPFTLMNEITVRVKDGMVIAIKVWKRTQS
jgi:hypothetical protein